MEEREERRRITNEALERVQVVRRGLPDRKSGDGEQISLNKPSVRQALKRLEVTHSRVNDDVQEYWAKKAREVREKDLNGSEPTKAELDADVKEIEVD